jgi:hypothetical protein
VVGESVFDNGGLGIDLGVDGPTPNDAPFPLSGANPTATDLVTLDTSEFSPCIVHVPPETGPINSVGDDELTASGMFDGQPFFCEAGVSWFIVPLFIHGFE